MNIMLCFSTLVLCAILNVYFQHYLYVCSGCSKETMFRFAVCNDFRQISERNYPYFDSHRNNGTHTFRTSRYCYAREVVTFDWDHDNSVFRLMWIPFEVIWEGCALPPPLLAAPSPPCPRALLTADDIMPRHAASGQYLRWFNFLCKANLICECCAKIHPVRLHVRLLLILSNKENVDLIKVLFIEVQALYKSNLENNG